MSVSTLVVGSLEALDILMDDDTLVGSWHERDVVIVPTAAAFGSMVEAAILCSTPFESRGARVEALMIADRTSNAEAHFVARIAGADVVVLSDGSALHARSVWRASPVGDALARARCLIAVGETATVLGATMIDPRGGAPTTGLGYREGLVVTSEASLEQLTRTRSLLDDSLTLAVVGTSGVLIGDHDAWRARGDVTFTRAGAAVDFVE